ncbi:hypothetical protein PGB90_005557 [Kerria lacca]
MPKQNSMNSIPLKYEKKAYKPVKFTPIPPREYREQTSNESCRYPLIKGYIDKPVVYKPIIKNMPMPLYPFRNYTELNDTCNGNHTYGKQFSEKQLKKENYSSDEGDVSSTEEETIKAEYSASQHNAIIKDGIKKIPTRFHQKNNKKMRMKRANTIDIPKLLNCEQIASSGDEFVYKSADELRKCNNTRDLSLIDKKMLPPTLELKTEKDRKFAAFLEQTRQEDPQGKTVTYNPSAGGGVQWSNRFSHIKTTFESVSHGSKSSSSPEELSKQMFKPIRKAATFPKNAPIQSVQNSFKHASKSPFKPVTRVVPIFCNSIKPGSRDSGYESRQSSFYHSDQHLGPQTNAEHKHSKDFFHLLEKQSQQQENKNLNILKTYYTPTNKCLKTGTNMHREYTGNNNYGVEQYSTTFLPHMKPNIFATNNCGYYLNPKSEYFLNEPNSYLHIPEYSIRSNFGNSQPVSPIIPTTTSSSPTYQDNFNPYLSLPTSPLPCRVVEHSKMDITSSPSYWKPVEFCEERPAISKIMGQPQQAIMVNSKTNYHEKPTSSHNLLRDFINSDVNQLNTIIQQKNPSIYQQLAQKSSVLQNFAQNMPKTSTKEVISSNRSVIPSKSAEIGTPPTARKQVMIKTLNENEENLPEQFFVQHQRNKFESLSAKSNAQPLPPQINEKAYFKPVSTTTKKHGSGPVMIQQSRSPPQSPIQMPSVLQKSESWHQMIMERMKQSKPPSPIKPKIPRAKSTHNLAAAPKQYEATLSPDSISIKQQTVEQFLSRDKNRQKSKSPKRTVPKNETKQETDISVKVTKLNEDFKYVDEAFEMLFEEANSKKK